jgi:hypothetical protein
MRRAGLKLNPEKCVFGVMKGKILGCLISAKRIEANPDKIRAIREMEEPKTKKDIQKLNDRVAALNRFISRSAERSLPFFKALKGKGKCKESNACSLRGGGGELGKLKTLTYGFTIFS